MSVIESLLLVPIRLPVVTLLMAGVPAAEISPLARTFTTLVPPPRLIVPAAAQAAADRVNVSFTAATVTAAVTVLLAWLAACPSSTVKLTVRVAVESASLLK